MTEAHGDEAAADLALGFCADLNQHLPDGAEDVKMIGDACLVRTNEAAEAVRFGLDLTCKVAARHGFPDVSVGMHTGTAARRGADWFGSAVNIAARVGERAAAGRVLLTATTREAAGDPPDVSFEDQGEYDLRHVSRPVRIFAAISEASTSGTDWAVDPVCRMRVDAARRAATASHHGTEFSFCSPECADKFAADPDRYAGALRG